MTIDDIVRDAEQRLRRPDDVEIEISPLATGWKRPFDWAFECALSWLIGEPIRPITHCPRR
jgi:hypothetical protein